MFREIVVHEPLHNVSSYNIREQTGMNDAMGWLLEQFGIESPPNISLENMITLFPDAGVEYLHF